jgi:uncharacterized protein (DUF58 family)
MIAARHLLHAVLALALLGAAVGLWPQHLPSALWWCAGAGLTLAAIIDGYRVRRMPHISIERHSPGVWPVGHWQTVQLTVHSSARRKLVLQLLDDYPAHWEVDQMPQACHIEPGHFMQLAYRLRPPQRGDADFAPCWVRVQSPWRLWWHAHRIGPAQRVKVFPDFSRLFGRNLNATDRRAQHSGMIRKRRRGEGTDFRQLREYRQGDSLRAIDWKATARQQKPIAREYQEERDQQVVFLLDTGRRMLAKDESGTHFDAALNAVLTLGFLAQKQGDAIGLMSFAGHSRWLSPHKGRAGLDHLLAGVYDLHPQEVAPDYPQAAQQLLSRLTKRAFVVIITNVRDEDDLALRKACELLATRHLVLCASLREKALDLALQQPVTRFDDALRVAASAHYLQQRQEAIKRLGIRASHFIDITPEQLSLALVQRYRDIKESGQL